MIYGIVPFFSLDKNELKNMILNDEIKFGEKNISDDLKDFVEKLLKKNWEERLGKDGDINEIKNHGFFKGFNFDELLKQKLESPFKPKFDGNLTNNNSVEFYNYEDLIKVELMSVKYN